MHENEKNDKQILCFMQILLFRSSFFPPHFFIAFRNYFAVPPEVSFLVKCGANKYCVFARIAQRVN